MKKRMCLIFISIFSFAYAQDYSVPRNQYQMKSINRDYATALKTLVSTGLIQKNTAKFNEFYDAFQKNHDISNVDTVFTNAMMIDACSSTMKNYAVDIYGGKAKEGTHYYSFVMCTKAKELQQQMTVVKYAK